MSARLMQPRTKEIIAHAASDFNKSVPHLFYNIMPAFGLSAEAAHATKREKRCLCASERECAL